MADSLSTSISMVNYKMPERIRRNCSRSFQPQIKSLFLRTRSLLRLISLARLRLVGPVRCYPIFDEEIYPTN